MAVVMKYMDFILSFLIYLKSKFLFANIGEVQLTIEIHIVFKQEIAKTIDNRFPLINLNRSCPMTMTSNYCRCTCIYQFMR